MPAPKRSNPGDAWRQRTNAQVLYEGQFATLKIQQQLHIVGIMGFAGSWQRAGLTSAELGQFIRDAQGVLDHEFIRLREHHAHHLVIASGATNDGVLQLVYELCDQLSITAMGIAPSSALGYDLGKMHYLIPFGTHFGDESEVFVRTSDELMLLGGGEQSYREVLMGTAAQIPITIFQGFGGVADQFTPATLPNARFIPRTASSQ